jgi:hypothetical protein
MGGYMNLISLREWARLNYQKKDQLLINEGVTDKKVSKVKANLKMIVERVDIISPTTARNNRYIQDVEEAIKDLAKWGLKLPEAQKELPKVEVKPEVKPEAPKVTNEAKV